METLGLLFARLVEQQVTQPAKGHPLTTDTGVSSDVTVTPCECCRHKLKQGRNSDKGQVNPLKLIRRKCYMLSFC